MSDHPYTREAIERWQQGKINIFDAMAALEDERDELLKKTGYWASLQNWLDMVHDAYEGQDRDGLNQLYMRGPFAGWSQEKMVRLADELWENSQKYSFHPKEEAHHE